MTNNNLPQHDYEKYRGLRAFLLTRVSSPGQSHDAQERVIREKLIRPLGLILDEERHVIHDTYTGLEYRYRAALDDILRMAERQEFDLLCLDVLDRGLGRKGVSREVFRGQLRELGIHILTTEPSDHSDDDSLEGQLMRLLKGYKAEEEVNDFVRRTKNAIRHKALGDPEKGILPKVVGNTTRLYGYKFVLSPKGKRETLELNYDVVWVDRKGLAWTEVRVVVFIFRCAKRRIALRAIARRLNDIGIPAPSISKGTKSKSKGVEAEKVIWQMSVVSRMLRHTGYSGKEVLNAWRTVKVPGKKWRKYTRTPQEEQIIVPIPAIVSEEWQMEVIKNLEQNRRWARRNTTQPLTLLRGGLGKCGNCGRNLSLQRRYDYYKSRPEDQRLHVFYRCSTKSTGTLHRCKGCYVSAITLDNAAWEKALEIIRNPSVVDEEIARRRSDDPTASRRKQINKELAGINAERNDLQATLLRMIRERKLDRNTENVLANRLKELEKLGREYNSELLDDDKVHRQWEATQKEIDKLHEKCAVMREKLNDPTYEPSYETKRELIEFFGIVATVWENGHKPKFKIVSRFPDIVLQFP
jgi:DNA invertase Pin-like site-specific DNA recombinase